MVIAMPSSKSPELGGDSSHNEAAESSGTSKKKSGLSLRALKSPFKFLGKTYCKGCRKKCSGEVLRVSDVYFHGHCFRCHGCRANLSQGGFFTKDKNYYCATCYQSQFGTKCSKCGNFVEGEVVSALGKTYHQNCFRCAGCQKPFPTGERVTYTGQSCLCQKCASPTGGGGGDKNVAKAAATTASQSVSSLPAASLVGKGKRGCSEGSGKCAECKAEFKDGQALMALDKHYHVWCFKCKTCGVLLHGEYMGKDGEPYCEKDYQSLFGVKCTYCFRFISGKVLQAGDNNHFHPTCARCTKCGEPFGDGEEMFLQGAAIWHPSCGPGPEEGGGTIINERPCHTPHSDFDRASTASGHLPAVAACGYSRTSSPGASLNRRDPVQWRSVSQMAGPYAHCGNFAPSLYNSSSTYSLRRPLEPGDRTGSTSHLQHFHLPLSRRSSIEVRDSRYSTRAGTDAAPIIHRPVSAPPKPGYTLRSSTLPVAGRHLGGGGFDAVSQTSSSHNYSSDFMKQSNTYTHGFRPSRNPQLPPPLPVMTEHKVYPVHLLMTTNFKMLRDVDRNNLEKHLSDADFQLVFSMSRNQFYSMPLWRRTDFKRRVRLF